MPPEDLPSALASAGWLAQALASGQAGLRPVDVRWYLDGRSGRAAYEAGHLPGAVHLDIDRDLASPRGPGRPGRHPLPSADAFALALARAGIGADATVVAYDDDGGATAARLWWLGRYLGHPARFLVLDGGLQAWQAAGGALEAGAVQPAPSPVLSLRPDPAMVVDRAAVQAFSGALLDARAAARYEGKIEPIDPRPGHIPGARSAPYTGNLREPRGVFLPPDELRARYLSLGAGQGAVAYCGSGVTACHAILAMHLAGIEARLYEGSWSDWSSDPRLPARLGSDP